MIHLAANTFSQLSRGVQIIAVIAVFSTIVFLGWPSKNQEGLVILTFVREHRRAYQIAADELNASQAQTLVDRPVLVEVVSYAALRQQVLGAFFSGAELPELVEFEINMASQLFRGPVDGIGFVPLNDLLERDRLSDRFVRESFSPWIKDGLVFGLPVGIQPCFLVYHADIIEEGGIDVSAIETWEDFKRELRPLMDPDGDGENEHYLIDFSAQHMNMLEGLMLQAGGGLFAAGPGGGTLVMASEVNAKVLAELVTWTVGPNRIAAPTGIGTQRGDQLREQAYVLTEFTADWGYRQWPQKLPEKSGRMKMMRLPAWEPGGRRTTVWGGTMLAIPATTEDVEEAWRVMKHLYLSESVARHAFDRVGMIRPVSDLWEADFYHKADPYFMDQKVGEFLIDLADEIPSRTTSPFGSVARAELSSAFFRLIDYADEHELFEGHLLEARALEELKAAEVQVRRHMNRSGFVRTGSGTREGEAP